LYNLYDIIEKQKYLEIKEWIIVEGSQTIENREKNIENIEKFIKQNKTNKTNNIAIKLIVPETIIPLSDLRNLGNDNSTGDIIVCMDDDDYYHEEYVSQIVSKFSKYDRLIAGCSGIYLYDYSLKKLYKFKGFHNNHTMNNCMAYKKEYLETHRYKEGLLFAEEYSFMNGFTEPMIQLNSEKCMIVSCHEYNTFAKSDFIHENTLLIEDKQITDFIPKEIFERMENYFTKV
jgi:glycosyltransferase involved in cell wall biosynthesis